MTGQQLEVLEAVSEGASTASKLMQRFGPDAALLVRGLEEPGHLVAYWGRVAISGKGAKVVKDARAKRA